MENEKKKYGLFTLSKTNKTKAIKKTSIFDDDDDSESDSEQCLPKYESSSYKNQWQKKINEAVEIDPTIFQYDEVYDQIKSDKDQDRIQPNVREKPRYINNLLKAAEKRKKEQEIRFERKIQKEREQEGDEFKDKECFVTTSYREKLEEMKKTHEELARKDMIDNMLDVTKQNDLNGFYRSLYNKSLFKDNDANEVVSDEKIKFNKSSKKINLRERNLHDDDDVNDENEQQTAIELKEELSTKSENKNKSEDDSTDRNISKISKSDEIKSSDEKIPPITTKDKDEDKSSSTTKDETEIPLEKENKLPEKKLTRLEIIEKLFTKRTVGEVFEEARNRYLQRKLQRTN